MTPNSRRWKINVGQKKRFLPKERQGHTKKKENVGKFALCLQVDGGHKIARRMKRKVRSWQGKTCRRNNRRRMITLGEGRGGSETDGEKGVERAEGDGG